MNKLTISFDTPAGVHSFTVQNGTHAQFQAAVAGVDNMCVQMPAPGSKVITADQWRGLCCLADVSTGVDPWHMVEQLIKRFG